MRLHVIPTQRITMARVELKADGGILLGAGVSCDGFAFGRQVRVQTHIHSDHMVDFDTSKANQTILMSPGTRDLLFALYDADLPYRTNIKTVDPWVPFELDGERIELVPSHHMLGSVQVRVTCADGYRVGYSSDFQWPVDEVISVDELIVDSTYGDPLRVRQYAQAQVDEHLLSVVSASIRACRPTALIGYNGRLQLALHVLGGLIDVPVICSPRAYALIDVYRRHGYLMPNALSTTSDEAIQLLRSHQPVLAAATFFERRHLPWVDRFVKVSLTGYMTGPRDPVTRYDNGDCCIAFTDHADFHGTLEYIGATGARMVWTDPRSGNAEALALAVSEQLGVKSRIAPQSRSLAWG